MPLDTKPWSIQDYITTPERQAGYIEAALEEGDDDAIATAIGDVVRARGLMAVAEETGLSREALYKAFRRGGNPTLRTLSAVLRPLGLRLTVVAAAEARRPAKRQAATRSTPTASKTLKAKPTTRATKTKATKKAALAKKAQAAR